MKASAASLDSDALTADARAALAAGRAVEAVGLFMRVLEADPAQVGVMKELAGAATRAGMRAEAAQFCAETLRRNGASPTAQLRLAFILHSLGAAPAAVREVVALAGRCGDTAACARGLSHLMDGADPAAPETLAALCLLIREGFATAGHAPLFSTILHHHPDVVRLAADRRDAAFAAAGVLRDPDVLRGLATLTVMDYGVERVLTRLRAAFLRHIGDDGVLAPSFAPLRPALMALAQQCFLNEYVWEETPEDRALCARLAAMVEEARAEGGDLALVIDAAAAIACFQPLLGQPWAGALLVLSSGAGDAGWAAVLRRQVEEPWRERELADSVNALGRITDPVSQAVRDQYQENPYPRWITLNRVEPHTLPQRPGAAPIAAGAYADILVAGCGTGHQAIQVAGLYPGARILAVDLSRPSLGYARRKTEEAGVTSITYLQADILNLGQVGATFDSIECGGVLHHMADPAAGLRVLADLLKPDGMMRLALYSTIARHAIIAGQALRAAEGFPADLAGIRAFRKKVFALPPHHPARGVAACPDMYSASECRDLVFHVQETCFDIPGLARLLAACGLVFGGFDNLPRRVQSDYQAVHPDDPAMMSLANWDAFERKHPETFIGMYQFWAYKIR